MDVTDAMSTFELNLSRPPTKDIASAFSPLLQYPCAELETAIMSSISMPALIAKKRDGGELSTAEVEYFVKGVVEGDVQGSQLGMVIYILQYYYSLHLFTRLIVQFNVSAGPYIYLLAHVTPYCWRHHMWPYNLHPDL